MILQRPLRALPSRGSRLASWLLLSLFLATCSRAASDPAATADPAQGAGEAASRQGDDSTLADAEALELYEVVKIVDGDTIHILRKGAKEKLRLLSVDTEEKLTPGQVNSASKPQTVFGEETRLWTIAFFEQLRDPDGKIRVGLRFPDGVEAYDVYGRLLCHVLLPDGTDFNLLLVELGKSPYFNKYGNSKICSAAFVEAQRTARRNLLGIWDPCTNRPATEGAPSAKRPYEKLLPWWEARAVAIDDFRARSAELPRSVLHAEDADALVAAIGREVEVFGSPDRFFDEDDGSLTVLFRATDRRRAFRASIPAASRPAFEAFGLSALTEEYRQNFVYVKGTLVQGERGPQLVTPSPELWRRAGPEP